MALFISCDWGTSNLRLRLVETSAGRVVADVRARSGRSDGVQSNREDVGPGIASVYRRWQAAGLPESERGAFYLSVLLPLIGELGAAATAIGPSSARQAPGHAGSSLAGLPLVISGMASSRLGLLELPYGVLPFRVTAGDIPHVHLPISEDFPHPIFLISGVRTADDVLRGEETQLLGAFDSAGRSSGSEGHLYIFPGTHSKHMLTKGEVAVSFQTFMTGEFFYLLSKQSILSASVAEPGDGVAADVSFMATADAALAVADAAFAAGVLASLDSSLLHAAFMTRTRQLLQGLSGGDNYRFLSGLLIGEELKGLVAGSVPVTIVGAGALTGLYERACGVLGIGGVGVVDADQALVRGHCNFYHFVF